MRAWCLGALLAVLGVAAPVHAQEDDALAREAYVLGSQLAKQGQWADALAAYERSNALRPHATTLFNIGYVERALGRLVKARASLKGALARNAANPGEMDAALVKEAQGYIAELERKIPRVTVRIDPPGSFLWIDAHPVTRDPHSASSPHGAYVVEDVVGVRREAPGTFELLIDPGSHDIRVESKDGRSLTRPFDVETAATATLDLTLDPVAQADPPDYGWPIALTALGGAGLVVGTFAGIAAFNKDDDLAEVCPTPATCEPQHQVDIDALATYTTISTAGFIIGGLVAAGGLTWITVTAVSDGSDTAIVVKPGGVAIVGRF